MYVEAGTHTFICCENIAINVICWNMRYISWLQFNTKSNTKSHYFLLFSSVPTSNSQKPVNLCCFISARVFAWTLEVFQLQCQCYIFRLFCRPRDNTVVDLFVERIWAGQDAAALVCCNVQVARNVEVSVFKGHKDCAFQVYSCAGTWRTILKLSHWGQIISKNIILIN